MLYLKNNFRSLRHFLVGPLIFSVFVPLLILDIWVEIYHRICFPLYGLPCVQRKNYIKIFDRARLSYLNWPQKLYCLYCGYANGVIRYWTQIAGETEHYWCGIQHKKSPNFVAPAHQKDFAKYGDEDDFHKKY